MRPPIFKFRGNMTRIVYKTPDFIIGYKPAGIPSQSDKSGDDDALSELSRELSAIKEPDELYLIHRLDRVVGGLLVFARSKKSAALLSGAVQDGELNKEYFAIVDGVPVGSEMTDYLIKDSILGKACVVSRKCNGAKLASLEYKTLDSVDYKGKKISLVKIKLHTGRFHQIRAQFSSRNMPLFADKKYGSKHRGSSPALFAYRIAFDCEGLSCDVSMLPELSELPWSLFDKEKYEIL